MACSQESSDRTTWHWQVAVQRSLDPAQPCEMQVAAGTVDRREEAAMPSSATVENQRQILANQRQILANQKRIEANQRKLDALLRNQKKLDRILANQRTILSKLR
jgi:hypothetical protein